MAEYEVLGFGGVPLVVQTWGDAGNPAVLLLHGIAQSRGVWRQTARDIAKAGRFAIAFDLRGHGQSGHTADGQYTLSAYVRDLRAVIDQLPDRPVVVGASAGGYVAATAIGEGPPHLASGLVLIDAAPWPDEPASQRIAAILKVHAAGFASVEDAMRAAVELRPGRPAPDVESLKARLKHGVDGRLYWNWDARVLGSIDMEEVTRRLAGALPRIEIPTLSVRGGSSEIVSVEAAARLNALIPKAECAEIAGAGHLVVSEQTETFNSVLLEFLERRVPREPLSYTKGADARTLRDALGCFATGITIITSLSPSGEPVGLTANSFTSLSLDPPLLLVCIAKTAGSLGAIKAADHFAVNVLHIGQQPASERFSRRAEDRFSFMHYETWSSGVPILSGSLASFECRREATHDGGDHVILVGHVERAQFEPRRDPLLYFRGKYRRLHFD
jgi:flavin reductase (DIM6/NTAB) family NADH-FMN oxidoreductase RutF/pimeloyl-ACP methyl ester carboxylesterase